MRTYGSSTDNPLKICVSNSGFLTGGFYVNAILNFQTTTKVLEYYVLQNENLTGFTNYDLYDLPILSSQEFLITVTDQNLIPIPNAIVRIDRKYTSEGDFKQVERPRTDTDGRTVGHFVLNDVLYNFYVIQNGQTIGTWLNQYVYCTTTDCRINLPIGSKAQLPDNFAGYKNISYSGGYDAKTRLYTFTYSSLDGISKQVNLTIESDQAVPRSYCSSQVNALTGTLTCLIPLTESGSAYVRIYINNVKALGEYIIIDLNTNNNVKYLMAILFILFIGLVGVSSGPLALLLFMVGLFAVGVTGLISWGGWYGSGSAIMFFVVAGLILMWKISREEK